MFLPIDNTLDYTENPVRYAYAKRPLLGEFARLQDIWPIHTHTLKNYAHIKVMNTIKLRWKTPLTVECKNVSYVKCKCISGKICSKNYQIFRKIKESLNKCRTISCLRIRRLNIVKTPIIIYRFNVLLIKTLAGFCVMENLKVDSKIHMEI